MCILKHQSSPRSSHYHHHVLLRNDVLFLWNTVFKLVSLQNIFPKIFRIIKMNMLENLSWTFVFFLVRAFLPCYSNGWYCFPVRSWALTLNQESWVCTALDIFFFGTFVISSCDEFCDESLLFSLLIDNGLLET